MKLKENKAKSLVDNAIHELIESLEHGQSDKLTQYLKAMGKFTITASTILFSLLFSVRMLPMSLAL